MNRLSPSYGGLEVGQKFFQSTVKDDITISIDLQCEKVTFMSRHCIFKV